MKRLNIRLAVISIALAIVLALGTLAGCVAISPAQTQDTSTPASTTTVTPINPTWTPTATSGQSLTLLSIADVVALVKPSVVAINTEVISYDFFNRAYTQEGAGSGWILDENGIIVTNNHVVEGASAITVTLDDGRTFSADPASVATDSLNDLAIIKIDAQNLPALKTGDASGLRVGDWVVAIGNALGQGIRATEGIISRKGVSLSIDVGETLYDLIETSAAINPGNSGGPLVNLAGEVIGITSAKVADIGVEGMGYAISINTAMPILEELITRGYVVRPWIGTSLYTVNQLAIQQLRLSVRTGVVIIEITSSSPAAQAGLKVGDVIVSIGGQDVSSEEELSQVLYASKIGEPLEITYYRGSSKSTVQVVPIETPPPS